MNFIKLKLISKSYLKVTKCAILNNANVAKYIKNFIVTEVVSIYYFLVVKNKRKTFVFYGMLLSKNFKKLSFFLSNSLNGEMLKIKFLLDCPCVFGLFKSFKYMFSSRTSKIYYKKKLNLSEIFENDPYKNLIISNSNDLEYYRFFKLVWPLGLPYVQTKKIRKKFRV